MSELFEITLADMVTSAEREVRVRQAAYPRFVAQGKMKQPQADREIAVMQAIVATLKELKG